MRKKSQVAMEFLLSYGVSMMIITVGIGSLAYFGMLEPNNFLPRKCQVSSPGLFCEDFTIDDDDVTIVLRNSGADSIRVTQIAYHIGDSNCLFIGNEGIQSGASSTITTTDSCIILHKGSAVKKAIIATMNVVNEQTGLAHKVKIDIRSS